MSSPEPTTDRKSFLDSPKLDILREFCPQGLAGIPEGQTAIPSLARNVRLARQIDDLLSTLPTFHEFHLADARHMDFLSPDSVHLVITSPPYWTLKKYNDGPSQLGDLSDYDCFLSELNKVWSKCHDALVPGGRLVCVVGDVCLSRRKNNGRHTVVPLHASIQEQCRKLGYDNLSPIIWHKIANATLEAGGNSSFLGKPYEPNAVIKNDIEFVLMERKPGGYRSPSWLERLMSVISEENHKLWFRQIWTDVPGASTRHHPAPFPLLLVKRLIRMFSFVGDTVLDPFHGSGTTSVACWQTGRNSVSAEVDGRYFESSLARFYRETDSLLSNHVLNVYR